MQTSEAEHTDRAGELLRGRLEKAAWLVCVVTCGLSIIIANNYLLTVPLGLMFAPIVVPGLKRNLSHYLRLNIRQYMAVIAILALVLAVKITLVRRENRELAVRLAAQREYDRAVGQISGAIDSLKDRVPRGVDPSDWVSALDLTLTANMNTFYRSNRPTTKDLNRLRPELVPALRGPVDVQTLVWIWSCLAQCCGKRSSTRTWTPCCIASAILTTNCSRARSPSLFPGDTISIKATMRPR